MKKEYLGENLINYSRYKNYFAGLGEDVKNKVIKRINELIKENDKYCDKGNYKHISNIFSALSLYEVLQEYTPKDNAFKTVSEEMWKTAEESMRTFKKIMKLPNMLKIIGKLLSKLFENGSGYGWKYTWHNELTTNDYLQFECNECIYQKIFSKYNVPELGPMFCQVDDITYSDLPNIKFTRNHTLCRDGQDCDFKFERKK